jgi:hypothetical protein
MTAEEKEEVAKLPKEYRPLTLGMMVLHFLLFSVPILGTIYWACVAFFGKWVALRSYARGLMVLYIAFLIFDVLFFVTIFWLSMLDVTYV